jgi:hypothetical protein
MHRVNLGSNSSRKNKASVNTTKMKTSLLERKINEDPIAWGTPEMILAARKRIKAGLPAAVPVSSVTGTASEAPVQVAPSKISTSATKQKSELAENKKLAVSIKTSSYPKIRAKYDLLIANVMESEGSSQRDKKARIKNLEFRYESEIQEKKYQKYTLWCLAGFSALAAFFLYAKPALV